MYDNNPDITVFAETNYRTMRRRFGIKRDDRRRHMYVVGKTGMGKSTLLENMIIDDIREGHGVGVVDPHGDLAEKILKFIPSDRINDIVYVNPSDFEYPVAFNILENANPQYKHLIASGLMGVFKKIWPDVWSARMEYILNNTLLALLDYPGTTMLAVNRMLSDKAFRTKVVDRVQDPVVKSFWVDEFAKYNDKFASEAIAPIQNKVGQFLSASVIRNIIGQVRSTINIRECMDTGKIIIMNLSKGRVGEDNSRLLGGMLITKIQLSAMERVDMPESERRDFYLYVDEFQNFATESFATILSEARKYRLSLVVAHQYIEQLDEKVAAAIFGNVGTMVVYRVGAADADYLVKEFTPRFIEEDLVNIPKFSFYLKLMIDGVASEPFSAKCLPPLSDSEITNNEEKVIRSSRERYAIPRLEVEEKIARWSASLDESAKEAAESAPAKKKAINQEMPSPDRPYAAQCVRCGKTIYLNFQPDGIRPVYDSECFAITRAEREAGKTGNSAPTPAAPSPSRPPAQSTPAPASPLAKPPAPRPITLPPSAPSTTAALPPRAPMQPSRPSEQHASTAPSRPLTQTNPTPQRPSQNTVPPRAPQERSSVPPRPFRDNRDTRSVPRPTAPRPTPPRPVEVTPQIPAQTVSLKDLADKKPTRFREKEPNEEEKSSSPKTPTPPRTNDAP